MSPIPDLNSLLSGGGDEIVTVRPEILDEGNRIAETLLKAGIEAWGTYLGRGVLYTGSSTRHQTPAEALEGEAGTMVISSFEWGGDRQGTMNLVLPAAAAKGAIAYFLAAAMGTEANPDATNLDAEAMDSYTELVNTLLGQGAQALRGAIGGTITLSCSGTRVVDFQAFPPAVELGGEEALCHVGQIVIEGLPPQPAYLLFPIALTGMDPAIAERPGASAGETESAAADDAKPSDKSEADRNRLLALRLKVPVVVLLAEKRMQMEMVRKLGPSSIIEFRKASGEFLDICAGKVKFAEGEVVIVNQHFGIQVRKLVDARLLKAADN